MTYELLITIAQLCMPMSSSGYRSAYGLYCQQQLIQCVELNPTPIQLAKCVKEGKYK